MYLAVFSDEKVAHLISQMGISELSTINIKFSISKVCETLGLSVIFLSQYNLDIHLVEYFYSY
jgi:hypothetical protein